MVPTYLRLNQYGVLIRELHIRVDEGAVSSRGCVVIGDVFFISFKEKYNERIRVNIYLMAFN